MHKEGEDDLELENTLDAQDRGVYLAILGSITGEASKR